MNDLPVLLYCSKKGASMFKRIFGGIVLGRFLIALVVVFSLYNPWGVSYVEWVMNSPFNFGMVVMGLAYFATLAFFIHSTWRAPAKIVYFGLLAVVVAVVYWMMDLGLISLSDPTVGSLIAQGLIAYALALGSVWSIVWRGATGQATVEDFDTSSPD